MYLFKVLLLLAILRFSGIQCKSVRKQLQNIKITTTTVKPVVGVEDKMKCDENVCSHIRKPVCSLVNGKPMTAPTRCELDNKIRCAKVLRSVFGSKVPVIFYLHDGECFGNESGDNSKIRKPKKNRKNLNKTAEIKKNTNRRSEKFN